MNVVHGLRSPLNVVVESRHRRNMLGTMYERARHRDHHPALEVAAIAVHDVAQHGILEYRFGGRMLFEKFEQLAVLEDASAPIYVQSDLIAGEIHEHERDVRTLEDITQTRHHAVAAIFGINQRVRVERLHESRVPGAKARVAFTAGTGSREKRHLHPADERPHRIVQVVDHLVLVKCESVSSLPVFSLQRAFSRRTQHSGIRNWFAVRLNLDALHPARFILISIPISHLGSPKNRKVGSAPRPLSLIRSLASAYGPAAFITLEAQRLSDPNRR